MKTESPALSTPTIPPFVVEIREKGKGKNAPWTHFNTALSENQADEKVASYGQHFSGYEFRSVPNAWTEPGSEDADAAELASLRDFRSSIVKICGTDDIAFLGASVKEAKEMGKENAKLLSRLEKTEAELQNLKHPDAKGPAPLKFKVGDTLRDVHTDILVTVTAMGAEAKDGDGFDFQTAGGELGHCPSISAEYYVPLKKAAKKKKKKK